MPVTRPRYLWLRGHRFTGYAKHKETDHDCEGCYVLERRAVAAGYCFSGADVVAGEGRDGRRATGEGDLRRGDGGKSRRGDQALRAGDRRGENGQERCGEGAVSTGSHLREAGEGGAG